MIKTEMIKNPIAFKYPFDKDVDTILCPHVRGVTILGP